MRSAILIGSLLLISLFSICLYFFLDLSFEPLLLGLVICSTLSIGSILSRSRDWRFKLIALLLFASAYHVAPLLRGEGGGIPYRVYTRDEAYQAQLTSIVYEESSWKPGIGTGLARDYSFYPVMPLIAVMFESVVGSGSGLTLLADFVLPLITAILPLVFYLRTVRVLTGNWDWAFWSTYVFSLNEQFLFFDSIFSYESMGVVFFSMVFYLLTKSSSSKLKVLLTITTAVLVMTHFWTSLNLLLFLAIFAVLAAIGSRIRREAVIPESKILRPSFSFVLISSLIFFTYTTLVAGYNLVRYGVSLVLVIQYMLAPVSRLLPNITMFRSTEEILLIIIGQLILVGFGALAFFARKGGPVVYLKTLFVLGGSYLATILLLLPSYFARPILHRGFFFGFLAIAPIVACPLHRSRKAGWRAVKASLLIFTMVSIVLMQDPTFRQPDFVASESQVFSGYWASSHVQFGSPFASMLSVADMFGTYGRMTDLAETRYYSDNGVLVTSLENGTICAILGPSGAHYFVASSSMNAWLLRYFIERYTDTTGQQYVQHALRDLSNDARFDRVFQADEISVFFASC